uniref:Acyl-CoA thioesterase-like C-terminal domain-containing protein n=1 Tax=Acrobeloides nanus TaxID=290746 RepID=A0A914E614_9BILA
MAVISSLNDVFKNIQHVEKIDERLFRSFDPHMGGAFILTRVFGGQSVAQSYLVGRKLFPAHCINKLEITFLGPGQTNLPIDYYVEDFGSSNGILCLIAKQKEKILFKCFLTYVSSPSSVLRAFNANMRYPEDVDPPNSYLSIETIVDMGPPDSEARERFKKVSKRLLFDLRPVDPGHFAGFSGELRPVITWCRLATSLHGVDIPEPIFIVMLISDYLVFQPAKILHDTFNRSEEYQTGSSLNHKIWIHHYDIDPYGFFLCVNDCELIDQSRPLLTGRIFDERKRCIATFIQESFIQKQSSQEKAKL